MGNDQFQDYDDHLSYSMVEWVSRHLLTARQFDHKGVGTIWSMQSWQIDQIDPEWYMILECNRYKTITSIKATKVPRSYRIVQSAKKTSHYCAIS